MAPSVQSVRCMKRLSILPVFLLVGCAASPDAPEIQKPIDGKADSGEKLCLALNQPATCDVCAIENWYGDGECDTFCAQPDQDCASAGDAAAFMAGSTYTTSRAYFEEFVNGGYGGYAQYGRAVATNLSQSNADAWSSSGAPLIGNGFALLFTYRTRASVYTLERGTDASGACKPATPDTRETVNLFSWQGGIPTLTACTVAGSVTIKGTTTGAENFTFNVQFSDGTTWVDKVIAI
jgi:hypothetical protein